MVNGEYQGMKSTQVFMTKFALPVVILFAPADKI